MLFEMPKKKYNILKGQYNNFIDILLLHSNFIFVFTYYQTIIFITYTIMFSLFSFICSFLYFTLPKHITAFSIVYYAMNKEHWIGKKNLNKYFII